MGATHKQASEELVEELEELKDAADELYDELKFQESHHVRQRHLALTRRVYGEGDERTVNSMMAVCESFCDLGDATSAVDLARQALALSIQFLGAEHEVTGVANQCLGNMLSFAGMNVEAEPYMRKALEIQMCQTGENHPDTAAILHDLGLLFMRKGEDVAAEPLFRRAEAIIEGSGEASQEMIACLTHSLGQLMYDRDDLNSAEPHVREALKIREEVLGVDHPDTLRTVGLLADVLRGKKDKVGAKLLYQRALAGQELVLGPDHLHLAITLFDYADFLESLKKKKTDREAIPLLRKSIAILQKLQGHTDGYLSSGHRHLGRLLNNDGLYEEALQHLLRAQEIRLTLPKKDPDTDAVINELLAMVRSNQAVVAKGKKRKSKDSKAVTT